MEQNNIISNRLKFTGTVCPYRIFQAKKSFKRLLQQCLEFFFLKKGPRTDRTEVPCGNMVGHIITIKRDA